MLVIAILTADIWRVRACTESLPKALFRFLVALRGGRGNKGAMNSGRGKGRSSRGRRNCGSSGGSGG